MAARSLVTYPDPRLRARAEPITDFGDNLRDLARDLIDTMDAVQALGITAPHIGALQRLVAIRLDPAKEARLYVNPHVLDASSDTLRHTEGSVSMPGVTEEIERPARVRVRVAYQDLGGVTHEEEVEGFMAACLLHEIDQLDGIFWIERLSRLKRERAIKRFEKLRRASS